MNKIYDVTLESPTLECNITLHSRADVERLQDFIWDCTNFEMCVKPRDEQGLKGLFEDMEKAADKFFNNAPDYSDSGLTEDEILKIEKALDDARKSTVLRIKTYKSMKVPVYGVHYAMGISTNEETELDMLEKENIKHSLESILGELEKDETKRELDKTE